MATQWVPYWKLIEVIGEESARALCLVYGGVDYSVPKKPNAELLELIGGDAWALCAEFPGRDIPLPNEAKRPQTKKDAIVEVVAKLRAQGITPRPKEIALMLGCTKRHVDGVIGDTTSPEEKRRIRLRRSKNSGVHRLPDCLMVANGAREMRKD